MNKKILTAALALAALVLPAAASADPVSSVKADLAQVTTDLNTANTSLTADLAKITSDVQAGNLSAARTDMQTFRTDRQSLLGTVKTDMEQLRTDVQAARAAKVDLSSLKPDVEAARTASQTARQDVQQGIQAARAAVQSARGSRSHGNTLPGGASVAASQLANGTGVSASIPAGLPGSSSN
jgi:opacity protein-like surface antigen